MSAMLAQAFPDANAPPAALLECPIWSTGRGSRWEEQKYVQQGLLLGKYSVEGNHRQFICTPKTGDSKLDCGG
jgi:hypothetical protein